MKASNSSKRRRQAAEPALADGRAAEVVLDVDVAGDRVHLVLANCGDALATDITVEFSRPLAGPGDALVSDLPVFKRLGVLRPRPDPAVFWNAASALVGRDDPFVATVTWNERSASRQRAEYRHDLSIYRRWPASMD